MLKLHSFSISLDKILFMHWYIWSMLRLITLFSPNFSTELWSLSDFRLMLNILWNNWWIWSNLVNTLIFFDAKTCSTTKISTVVTFTLPHGTWFCMDPGHPAALIFSYQSYVSCWSCAPFKRWYIWYTGWGWGVDYLFNFWANSVNF